MPRRRSMLTLRRYADFCYRHYAAMPLLPCRCSAAALYVALRRYARYYAYAAALRYVLPPLMLAAIRYAAAVRQRLR